MFISHDLGVVEQIADYVAVMYHGRFVEMGTRNEVFDQPTHPYTCRLLESAPQLLQKETGQYKIYSRQLVCPEPPKGFVYDDREGGSGKPLVHEGTEMVAVGDTHYVACISKSKSFQNHQQIH